MPSEGSAPGNLFLHNTKVSARLSPLGAELRSLRYGGSEQLWSGDPAWWPSVSPLLFPVVGRCFGDTVSIEGRAYPMQMHGFLARRLFHVSRQEGARVVLETESDADTMAGFPFVHRVRVTATLTHNGIAIDAEIANLSDRRMPYCFGFHPAFPWPRGPDRRQFVCRFATEEGPAIRKTDGDTGLLRSEPIPSPVRGRTLELRDELFDRGLQFEDARSRWVWFGQVRGTGTLVTFPDCDQLAIWTKPGAPLLSIEPWQGFPQEASAGDALERRHGVRFLASGEVAVHRLRLGFGIADPAA